MLAMRLELAEIAVLATASLLASDGAIHEGNRGHLKPAGCD
jgi:hypothetical protein